MKKFLLAIVAILCVSAVSAQKYENSIGLRIGYGAELQYERHFSAKNYLEANLGIYGYSSEFNLNATYNWNLCEWNWTPRAGKWFLSAGVGGSLAFAPKYFNVGVAGDVAFGIRFNKPWTVSLDYRPTLYFLHNAWGHGFAGVALTGTYNF